jgi:hypothetical protein
MSGRYVLLRSCVALCGVAQFLDVWSTNHALSVAGTVEANPVAQTLMAALGPHWGVPKYLLGAAAIFVAWRLARFTPGPAVLYCALASVACYGVVIVNNVFQFV